MILKFEIKHNKLILIKFNFLFCKFLFNFKLTSLKTIISHNIIFKNIGFLLIIYIDDFLKLLNLLKVDLLSSK